MITTRKEHEMFKLKVHKNEILEPVDVHARRGMKKELITKGGIRVEQLSIGFWMRGKKHVAVENVDLAIAPGEFVCLLGPSGCGKSTLLNAMAGHVRPARGAILIDDKPVTGPGSDRGMVFQQHSLFPWKTVKENIAFGPRMSGHSSGVSESIARTFLGLVGLMEFADRYPATLSGGMQQRVGIARALANYPSVLLMDEPFGALDAQTKIMMQENLLNIWAELKTTVVFVTHDIDEAIFLGDRVLVMSASPGRIIADLAVEIARPRTHETIMCQEFVELKKTCLSLIKKETLKSFSR